MKKSLPDYPFESNYLPIKGGKIHFIDEGEGPAVLLVHGNPTWSFYFRKLISLLSENHRVVAIDHMGCGLSDKPQNYQYTLTQHIENLAILIRSIDIDHFSLIVHDWGGPIGIGCGINRLEKLEKIVVMNSAAFRSSKIPLRIRLCRMPVLGEPIVRLLNGFAWPARFMAVENRLERAVSDAYILPYDSWENRIAIYNFVKDIPLNRNHLSYDKLVEIEENLSRMRVMKIPLLLLWGGKDFCFNDFFYKEWVQRFPGAERHYFEDGGHYVLEDKFSEIGPIVQDFLNRERVLDD